MRIYLDHNATTPLRAEVVERMSQVLRDVYGNPSSTHEEGAAGRRVIEEARDAVATCLGCDPREIVFTAGATEANNALLQGLRGNADGPIEVVTTTTEHPSVLAPAATLEAEGVKVQRLPVDSEGCLDLDDLSAALGSARTLVSIIWANNETGIVQPIAEIAERVKAQGSLLHVDATQAVGKWPIDLSKVPIDFLSCSAHKLNGPKGSGCLFVRSGLAVPALLRGGGQERGARGGTENTAGIAGFGVACELARSELPDRMKRYAGLRDRLWEGLLSKVGDLRWNGQGGEVLPNTLNVEFRGAAGEVLLQALDLEGVAVSAGAACHSGSVTPSHVLAAMGRSNEEARSTLRLSVGLGIDEAAIDLAVDRIAELVPRARVVADA